MTPLVEPVPSAPAAMMASAIYGDETPPACITRTPSRHGGPLRSTGRPSRGAASAGADELRRLEAASRSDRAGEVYRVRLGARADDRLQPQPTLGPATASAGPRVERVAVMVEHHAVGSGIASVSAMTRPIDGPGPSTSMAWAKSSTPLRRSWIGAMSAVGTVRMTWTRRSQRQRRPPRGARPQFGSAEQVLRPDLEKGSGNPAAQPWPMSRSAGLGRRGQGHGRVPGRGAFEVDVAVITHRVQTRRRCRAS